MSNDYYTNIGVGALIVSAFGSLVATAKMLAGIKPRLERAEDDINKLDGEKAEKSEIISLETLMNTQFKSVEKQFISQGREIGEIKAGVNKLLDRRNEPR